MRSTTLALASLLVLAGCSTGQPHAVAVLTDFGTKDHYAAILTANVLRANPDARILTITHEIEPFNIVQGAFVLAEAVPEFPAGTVVLAVVDPGVGSERAPIVAVTKTGHVLVGPDNGLFDPLIRRTGGAKAVYRIANPALMRPDADSSTFHGRDLFAPVAGHLSRGVAPAAVGPALDTWVPLALSRPTRQGSTLQGTVIHVDRYGNLLTNIPGEWLAHFPFGTTLEIGVGDARQTCTWQKTYGDVPAQAYLVLRSASGNLEVAQNLGNAARTLGVRAGSAITLRRVGNAAPRRESDPSRGSRTDLRP